MAESYMTFEEAVAMLKNELNYPEEKALHYVQKFDANRDGRLSSVEFRDFLSKVQDTKKTLVPKFQEYDKDGNGYISLDEASQILSSQPFNFPASKVVLLLKKFDQDGNGKLDIEEFAEFYAEAKATHADVSKQFDLLDRDGNGVLTPDEVICVIKKSLGFDDCMAQHMVDMFDQNKDGSLDKMEFMQMWSSMFG